MLGALGVVKNDCERTEIECLVFVYFRAMPPPRSAAHSCLAIVVRSLPCVACPPPAPLALSAAAPPCNNIATDIVIASSSFPHSLVTRCSSRHTPPALAATNRRSLSSRTTLLLLSSVFSFAPLSASSTVQFDAVQSAPGCGAAVALSAPPPGPTKSSSSSSQGDCRFSSRQPGRR